MKNDIIHESGKIDVDFSAIVKNKVLEGKIKEAIHIFVQKIYFQ